MYPVSGGTRQVPALRVRQRRRHLVRLLLLAAGRHGRADRVLRGHAVRLVLLARPLRLRHEERHRGSASRMTIVLMALFTAINFLGMKLFPEGQRGHHVVEGRRPGPGHHRAAVQVPRQQLRRRRRASCRAAIKALFGAHPVGGHRLRLPPASSRPTSSPARSRTRSAICRWPSSSRASSASSIYVMLQVVFIGAMKPNPHHPDQPRPRAGTCIPTPTPIAVGPFAGRRGPGRAGLAGASSCGSTPSSPRPAPG